MQWLGMRVRSRTARTSCCCETAATTPLVLATSTEVGSMSGVTTIDTGARSAVTAATGRNAGRTESAVQHDTNSAATAVRTRRALIVANSTVSCEGGHFQRTTHAAYVTRSRSSLSGRQRADSSEL